MSEELSVMRDTFSEGRDLMKRIVEQNEEILKMNAKMVEILALPPPMIYVPPVVGQAPDETRDFTWSGRRGG